MSGPPTRIVTAAASRVGPHHVRNEDAWKAYETRALRPGGLFVVCDGVSTSGRGAWAARLACERLGQFGEHGPPKLDELLSLVSEIDWELRGSGEHAACTLAAAWLDGEHAHLLTVGDSRIYRLRMAQLERSSPQGGSEPRRLNAYLGMGPSVAEQLHIDRWAVQPGDTFFVMSDGVVDALDEEDLVSLWLRTPEPGRFVRRVLEEVARMGTDDDATILVIEVAVDPNARAPDAPEDPPDPLRSLTPW